MADPTARPDGMPDFSKMSNDMYRQWEQAMTAWWDQVLDSPDFLKATGQNLSAMAQARHQYEKSVDEGLQRMHLPTRQDLVRVARISTLLEERLLQMEDTLLRMEDRLDALARDTEKETVQARVDAAETRVELREKLDALQARLDSLEEKVEAAGEKTPTRRKRSTAASKKKTTAKKTAAKKTE